eukprot:766065-Hanusia_phi.AAC.2
MIPLVLIRNTIDAGSAGFVYILSRMWDRQELRVNKQFVVASDSLRFQDRSGYLKTFQWNPQFGDYAG